MKTKRYFQSMIFITILSLFLTIPQPALVGAAASSFASGTFSSDQIIVWGNNDHNQINVPSYVTDVIAVSAGGYHTLALKSDGTVVGWGFNGQSQSTPPGGLNNVIAISAGIEHNIALKSDGTIVAWGVTSHGVLDVPTGLTDVIAISAGQYHNLALKSDGTVVAWGWNDFGQATVPDGLSDVIAVSAGYTHSLALKSDGTVVAWGYNFAGQADVPAGLTDVIAISAGGNHNLALKSDGTVVGWGYDSLGQASIPSGLTDVIAVSAGDVHSIALKSDGTVVAWGWDYYGQSTVPSGLANVSAISAGYYHNVALVNPTSLPPVLPSSFYGEIHVNDNPPIAGNALEAYLPDGSGIAASATINAFEGGLVYSFDIPGTAETEGDTVTFKIGGRVVATSEWHSGTNVARHIHPPEALPGELYSGGEGTAIHFSASANDWGNDASTYQWDWNNDGVYDETAQTTTHTWNQFGTNTVGLKVMDAQHGEGTTSFTVSVTDVPPSNVSAGEPYNATSGQPVTLNGSAACASVDTCLYEWDLNNNGVYDDATGTSATKTWYTLGDYTVGLRVTDSDNNAVTASADVHVAPLTHSLALTSGWNLVSFNVHPADPAIASVLTSLSGKYDLIYAWDATGAHASAGHWLKADNVPASPDSLTELNEAMGFWVHMTQPATLNVTGSMPTRTSIAIQDNASGWNLVGYPSVRNDSLPAVLSELGTDFSLVYAYHANDSTDLWKLFDRLAPVYVNDLTQLSPGWGYWIKASADHTWNVIYDDTLFGYTPVSSNADWTPFIREFDGVPMTLVPAGCLGTRCFDQPFWIDVYEVTNQVFGAFPTYNPTYYIGDNLPREMVYWHEAKPFCEARGARLPSEWEWEYAARGPDLLTYPWGNVFVSANAVYSENNCNTLTRQGDTVAGPCNVGSRPGGVSWVGAYDLAGNLWEWTLEEYDPVQYPGGYYVIRGGSWYLNYGLNADYRLFEMGEGAQTGFRCVRDVAP